MNLRQLFLRHVAQTSGSPMALEIVKAEGCVLIAPDGREYLDLIGGISVANTGHRHPAVLEAMQKQMDAYLHIMVYGELVQGPQVSYAALLAERLPEGLHCVYFTNSGSEAVEGAMKLAKKYTGRTGIAAFEKSYHGSTQGALSIMGDEYWRQAYRPLIPGVFHLRFNSFDDLELITDDTACVVAETLQAEAGMILPADGWLQSLREKCTRTGALLVLDEIQSGFGRTGKNWGFEHYGIEPDILLLGKALGGGLPLGAFISSAERMQALTDQPVLGHITTFGGHPLSCAAGQAAFRELMKNDYRITVKEELFRSLLKHPAIKEVRSMGLWLAVELQNEKACQKLISYCLQNGVFTDWFLFAPQCMRISPPLVISEDQIREACRVIMEGLDVNV